MDKKGLSPYNTRLFKLGEGVYELRCASASVGDLPGLTEVAKHEGVSSVGGSY